MTINSPNNIPYIAAYLLQNTSAYLEVTGIGEYVDAIYRLSILNTLPDGTHPFYHSLAQLPEGTLLHLTEVELDRDRCIGTVLLVIAEPHFLIDISALSECFKPYGAHALNYYENLLSPKENTYPILLGHIANHFLDKFINETPDKPLSYAEAMHEAFSQSPFLYASCSDFKDTEQEHQFFEEAQRQFYSLQTIVHSQFEKCDLSLPHVVIEPSFVSHVLGIQGRLDVMSISGDVLVELKSGRVSQHKNHEVQTILYHAILHYALGIAWGDTSAYLLYSKVGEMRPVQIDFLLLQQVIEIRNTIISIEHRLCTDNTPRAGWQLLAALTPKNLNTAALSGFFWEEYCLPALRNHTLLLDRLQPIEKEYVSQLMGFVAAEKYISKVGYENELPQVRWHDDLEHKQEQGEIIVDMYLLSSQITSVQHIIVLSLPYLTHFAPPNFRVGDMVVCYQRNSASDTLNNRLHTKGVVIAIDLETITLQLRIVQRNPIVFDSNSRYAIEHDVFDTGFAMMYKGIGLFLRAQPHRRALLLGEATPASNYVSNNLSTEIDRVVGKALASHDYFLLVGPPGSGKTSIALKKMVEQMYNEPNHQLLLVAYTNRAVDEICRALESIDTSLPYLRLGNRATCEESYCPHLLKELTAECVSRSQVTEVIARHSIVVSTLSTLQNHTEIFRIKRFDTAIVDEASQILEPQVLSLWCAVTPDGESAIGRFIFIGDQKQLSAIVAQPEHILPKVSDRLRGAGITDFGQSFFRRLLTLERRRCIDGDSPYYDQLTTQGRMHPELSLFPSVMFYQNMLRSVPLPHQEEPIIKHAVSPSSIQDMVYHYRLGMVNIQNESICSSKSNEKEAEVVALIAYLYYNKVVAQGEEFDATQSLGIITPYRNQIAAIKQALLKYEITELSNVCVDTVERYQGSQRQAIIYSCCVNHISQLAFLCNTTLEDGINIDRKLNVALTRAQKQLFIIGNLQILSLDSIYSALISHIRENQGILNLS